MVEYKVRLCAMQQQQRWKRSNIELTKSSLHLVPMTNYSDSLYDQFGIKYFVSSTLHFYPDDSKYFGTNGMI